MNVLCELGSTVHTGGYRSQAFHLKRQEALSTQVSEWWHQSSTPCSGVVQTLFLSLKTIFSQKSYGLNWVK